MDPDSMIDTANTAMTFGAKFADLIREFAQPLNERRLGKARMKSLVQYADFHSRNPELEFSCDENGLQVIVASDDDSNRPSILEPRIALADALSSNHQERRAENVASVIQEAGGDIPFDQNVVEEPVDEAWFLRFLDQASYASDADVRSIWAKILSEEVSQSGTCSIRTLSVLGQLGTAEAKLFEKTTEHVTASGRHRFISNEATGGPLTYEEFMKLQEAGLLTPSDGTELTTRPDDQGCINFFVGNFLLIVRMLKHSQLKQSVMMLSAAGEELCRVLEANSTLDAAKGYARTLVMKPNVDLIEIHRVVKFNTDGTCRYETKPLDTIGRNGIVG